MATLDRILHIVPVSGKNAACCNYNTADGPAGLSCPNIACSGTEILGCLYKLGLVLAKSKYFPALTKIYEDVDRKT